MTITSKRRGSTSAYVNCLQACVWASPGDFQSRGGVTVAVVRGGPGAAVKITFAGPANVQTSVPECGEWQQLPSMMRRWATLTHFPHRRTAAPSPPVPTPTPLQDRAIGRPVVRLSGSVPCANSLRLPRRREASLGAAGRYLYFQLRFVPGQSYSIHVVVAAADGGLHRLTLTNLHSRPHAKQRSGGVQVVLPALQGGWMLLAFDLPALLAGAQHGGASSCGSSRSSALSAPCLSHLHSLDLCANLVLRGAFTSDYVYDWQVRG